MTTSHALVRLVLGSSAVVPIELADYRDLAEARAGLFELRFAEEKFDVLVQNYLEIETELLSSTARQLLCGDTSYEWFHTERSLLNRRLLNLLSSTRGYIDYMGHVAKNLERAGVTATEPITAKFSERYDASISYRVMEALRNYTQHRGFPVHSLSYESKRVSDAVRNQLRFGVAIHVSREELVEDGKFKKSVLEELPASPDKIDLKPMLRDYVADLATAHE